MAVVQNEGYSLTLKHKEEEEEERPIIHQLSGSLREGAEELRGLDPTC